MVVNFGAEGFGRQPGPFLTLAPQNPVKPEFSQPGPMGPMGRGLPIWLRQYARDMGRDLADKFVGMYVNHWTLNYGDKGRESIRRFLVRAHRAGLISRLPELEFVQ